MHAHPIAFLELLNGQVQYVVPRWQRRYRWGESEIGRLIDDLLAVAQAGPSAGHYGGTLLTFPEPGMAAGTVTTIRVVDGQQRLTTVSILLACIAERLGPDGDCDGWTAEIIHSDRLTNPGKPPAKLRKLRLQDGDEEEYGDVLAGHPRGAGAVTQAWRTIRRLVADNDVASLLRGLGQLRVVSIGLDAHEDPQQIFESLNATGRPLAESEKVKNWLLMGLPDAEQQELHDGSWREIERVLGATHATARVDEFLRDVLRWWTGRLQGIDTVYDVLRRLASHRGLQDRPQLCRDLAELARHYGILTGTGGEHQVPGVERHLRHLRAMGIHVHRPLTLRLLHDAERREAAVAPDELSQALGLIAAWVTRLWLAGRPTAGLNKAVAELARGAGPSNGDAFAAHWLRRINALRGGRAGVPDDDAVREGVRTRRAYGGSATPAAFAVLCAIMEAEHREEAPARDRLTMEHVMPQKLTPEWREQLGDDAESTHATYRHRLANLTLSGDATNASMGAKSFADKADVYRNSTIGMTRELAKETGWNEETLERRGELLTTRAIDLWPWEGGQTSPMESPIRWRLEEGDWNAEDAASSMVLSVAGALIERDSVNAHKLSGETLTRNVQPASRFPSGSRVGGMTFRAVPGCEDWVLYPYHRDYPTSAERCRWMGQQCGVLVDVEFREGEGTMAFWRCLKEKTGGLPGQTDQWRGATQWTSPLNPAGDRVCVHVGNPDLLWVYIRSGTFEESVQRSARMQHYSAVIRSTMVDQQLGDGSDRNSKKGWSLSVQRPWARADRDDWPEAASWITEQVERLAAILQAQ